MKNLNLFLVFALFANLQIVKASTDNPDNPDNNPLLNKIHELYMDSTVVVDAAEKDKIIQEAIPLLQAVIAEIRDENKHNYPQARKHLAEIALEMDAPKALVNNLNEIAGLPQID